VSIIYIIKLEPVSLSVCALLPEASERSEMWRIFLFSTLHLPFVFPLPSFLCSSWVPAPLLNQLRKLGKHCKQWRIWGHFAIVRYPLASHKRSTA